jgi:hypothetical protein
MLGSSVINPFSGKFSVTGPTGPTGPTGSTGPQGFGITGPTGTYVIGITITNKILTSVLSNGEIITAEGSIAGPTGSLVYIIDANNLGSGYTFASVTGAEQDLDRSIFLKGITLNNNTSSSSISFESLDSGSNALLKVYSNVNTGITSDTAGANDLVKITTTNNKTRALRLFYDTTNYGINFVGSNLVEKAVLISDNITGPYSYCSNTATSMGCTIDAYNPNNDNVSYGIKPAVYIIDAGGKDLSITIKSPPNNTTFGGKYASSFSLYVRNAKNPETFANKFKGPINWPNKKPPCFGVTADGEHSYCTLLINFYALQGVWNASVVNIAGSTCELNGFKSNCNKDVTPLSVVVNSGASKYNEIFETFEDEIIELDYDIQTSTTQQKNLYLTGTTGACCLSNGNCYIGTVQGCTGYFHGPGTTCGTNNIICNLPGSCCIQYKNYNSYLYNCINDLTCIECLGYTGMNSVGIKYNGNYKRCDTITCSDLFQEIGACCSNNVCNGGTGACCSSDNSCSNDIGYAACISSGGVFLGDGTNCTDYSCPEKDKCLGYIDGVRIYPGDEYGGGVVVGKFVPGQSSILGVKEFFNPGITYIPTGFTYNLQSFTTNKDYTAYHTDSTGSCTDENSYVMIVYPYDICVNNSNTVVNPFTKTVYTDTFVWSHGTTHSSWGPFIDDSGSLNDIKLLGGELQYSNTHMKYSEGYFNGITGATMSVGLTLSQTLYSNSFQTCAAATRYGNDTISRVFGKSVYSLNGVWHNSWGLHNSIRLLSAENCRNLQIVDINNNFVYTDFITGENLTAIRATRLLDETITSTTQGITANNSALSNWYLPSHDELGFIAINCSSNSKYLTNFNESLLLNGYQPLSGVYWTSNGTFNFKKNEGIFTGTTASPNINPGSKAWAFDLDITGNVSGFYGYKYDRTNKAKVRPIRMLRCDRYYPEINEPDYILWKLPKSSLND